MDWPHATQPACKAKSLSTTALFYDYTTLTKTGPSL